MTKLVSILINFGILFLLGYFWILPQYQTLQGVNFELESRRIELQNKEEYFSKIEAAQTALGQYIEGLSKIDSAIPSEPFLSSVLNITERAGTENGLVLGEIGKFETTDFERLLKETTLEVEMVGNYPALKNFLSALEKSSRLIIVENVTFSTPKEKEPFAFTLKVKTYSY